MSLVTKGSKKSIVKLKHCRVLLLILLHFTDVVILFCEDKMCISLCQIPITVLVSKRGYFSLRVVCNFAYCF
jgi:hypothetical protein